MSKTVRTRELETREFLNTDFSVCSPALFKVGIQAVTAEQNVKNELSPFCDALLSFKSRKKRIDKVETYMARVFQDYLEKLYSGDSWVNFTKPFHEVGLTHAIWIFKYLLLCEYFNKRLKSATKTDIYNFICDENAEKCVSWYLGEEQKVMFNQITIKSNYKAYCEVFQAEVEFDVSDIIDNNAYQKIIVEIVRIETGLAWSYERDLYDLNYEGWNGFTEFYTFKLVNNETKTITNYPQILSILAKFDKQHGLEEVDLLPNSYHQIRLVSIPSDTKNQSIYFKLDETGFWKAEPGIFGQEDFVGVIGKGAQGVVLEGLWKNEEAAFKFCPVLIENIANKKAAFDAVARKLAEINELKEVQDDHIVEFFGNYRFV